MLARCVIQPLRTSSLLLNRPPAKALLVVRDSFKSQLIKDRKPFSLSPRTANNKPNSYEKLRARQTQIYGQKPNQESGAKNNFKVQSLEEFEQELSELGLVMKFKKIVSEYYHVIVGVHLVTSCFWFATTCLIKYQFQLTPGPLIKFLESYNVPQFFLVTLKNPYFEIIAVPYFLYKLFTPLRYWSTIKITMFAIRRWLPRGLIQARPTPKIIQKIYGTYKRIEKKRKD